MIVKNIITSRILLASVWLKYGLKCDAPLRPNTPIYINPGNIKHKTKIKPPADRVPPTAIAGGDWDCVLEPIADDIVKKSFHKHFKEGEPWDDTGYIKFLSTDVSEHGNRSRDEARKRCERIDELYEYIESNGYKTQKQLEKERELIQGLSGSIRPPAYREIAVNITRDGEFVWHAGMHRLVIAQLLELDEIPVRVNTRHAKWQEIREQAYRGQCPEGFEDHLDINWLK